MKKKLYLLLTISALTAHAQQTPIQYFRSNDQTGLNVFETTKKDTTAYTGFKLKMGGNFTLDFQGLNHQNRAIPLVVDGVNTNQLVNITNGFNLAMANLNLDTQLDDGIRMNLTIYLSSRHHEETWVKGGYIQFDKLPFLKNQFIDDAMKNITIKVGAYDVDYGDQHYRRSDGGNAIYNPFIENYILDEFATEIGGEVYYHHNSGWMAMVGLTNGALNPTVVVSTKIDAKTGELNKPTPAFHGKLGYDKQIIKDLRIRLTGSVYAVKRAANNTLFAGDRTGSHYFYVLENTTATAVDNFKSGRFNPEFSQEVTAFMVNPFVKFKGFELFGTYEIADGRKITENDTHQIRQSAVDLIYRFPEGKENFWIGGRYNTLKASPLNQAPVTINRAVASAGWFLNKNILMKAEYVNQEYKNFAPDDIRYGGKFNGFMIEATVGF
ncbi:hypothetical protein FNO01nite_17340 [Flavobacterium noncentrifugens]|uniref:Phosphate-selective porin O and P n=1 Tax=Flavobacterium noncentrifugens TaxID=1128970 RepID=A0A1G8WV30_9FLAO|nr:hypothetical protein [Flavobacterium noncentrifugens]GEP51062.1 hypothetical protein FNO01nite_17340 [Flavobacterium noncentrifugens]SDJ82061.1 hypothetical protein SAMN04487935_1960 [Flavobacterium noncentrifugens]